MKRNITLFGLFFICNFCSAQNKWFTLYSDSSALVKNADEISKKFTSELKKIKPNLDFKVTVIKNTTPFLIFINKDTINLPFYSEVVEPQKDFFTEVSGGKNEGKEVFGLFFNGFYLIHEIGHSLSAAIGKTYDNAYSSEYEANVLSVLHWKKVGKNEELKKCYEYAKKSS